MPRIYVDIETTGFSPTKDAIIEIGVIVRGKGIFGMPTFQSLVNPGDKIKGMSAAKTFTPTKIKVKQLRDAPHPESVAEKLHAFLKLYDHAFKEGVQMRVKPAPLYSFNAPFEIRFLKLKPWNLGTKRWAPCVMKSAKRAMHSKKMPSLAEAAKHYHIGIGPEAHAAMVDAIVLMKVHEHIMESRVRL